MHGGLSGCLALCFPPRAVTGSPDGAGTCPEPQALTTSGCPNPWVLLSSLTKEFFFLGFFAALGLGGPAFESL